MQVEFTYATEEQARELFERMYEADSKGSITVSTNIDHHNRGDLEEAPGGFLNINGKYIITKEIKRIAASFATKIPAKFSPIQEFLIKKKKDLYRALVKVNTWVNEILSQKASKKKVM